MYQIPSKPIQNLSPWNMSMEVRKRILVEAKLAGKKIALCLYNRADDSTFRYRGYNIYQATLESNHWQSIYFFQDEIDGIKEFISQVSLLVMIRFSWIHKVDMLIEVAHKYKVKVLFDVDDMVCDLNYLSMLTNTLNVDFDNPPAYDFWFSYISRLEFTARKVDGFLTTNTFLGGLLESRFGKPYHIIYNAINSEQLEMSRYAVSNKKSSKKPFTIGYFSGTPSHINDFKAISSEIVKLLEDYPEMTLNVVGYMEFPANMRHLIDKKRIIFTPFVNFIELQRLMAEVDLNIVPLVNNTFTNCKSELKFFEAAVVKTLTVATPIHTYRTAIRHGVSGFLANEGQWYKIISDIYTGKYDVEKIVNTAYQDCMSTYCGENFLTQIETAYNAACESVQ